MAKYDAFLQNNKNELDSNEYARSLGLSGIQGRTGFTSQSGMSATGAKAATGSGQSQKAAYP